MSDNPFELLDVVYAYPLMNKHQRSWMRWVTPIIAAKRWYSEDYYDEVTGIIEQTIDSFPLAMMVIEAIKEDE